MCNGLNQVKSAFNCRSVLLKFCLRVFPVLFCVCCARNALADIRNFMCRIEVKPGTTHTRIAFKLEKEGDYYLSTLSDNRLSITFPGTLSSQFRKLQSYSDSKIEKISFRRRNGDFTVIVAMKGKDTGYRLISPVRQNLVTLDVGTGIKQYVHEPVAPGREKIWSGTERLIREFEPPVRPDVPFIPSDGILLRKMMPGPDVKLFLNGEAAIYKEKPSEAEEIFRRFIDRETPVKAMALFRLGEALCMMQKYNEALSFFREGEKLCPEYIVRNPSAIFYYADCLAREGDLEAGRKILARLVIGLSGTDHAPSLLVRLADMYRHAGRDKEALCIYRNIETNFPRTRAFNSARMRMCDRDFFNVNSVTCQALIGKYRSICATASDQVLQDESMFKAALLEALYRTPSVAVESVSEYEKKFPRGIFSNVAKSIHEDLLVDLFHELKAENDCSGLLAMIGKNMNRLEKCLGEEGFIKFISKCYVERGMTRQELTLFTQLADSEWAAASAPFIYSRILDDAMALGEKSLAEGAARAFLRKFPGNELAWGVTERLGEICYTNGNMRDTVAVLSCLLQNGARIERPESLYYLGKAEESLHNTAGAGKAMAFFVDQIKKRGADSPFQADAYMVMASARLAGGDGKGAMSLYRAGYAVSGGEYRDAFLFKMGDLSRQEGNLDEARDLWKKVVKEGSDSLWKKMASEELADLEWRARWKYGGK